MPLYHFSEERGIALFVPRAPVHRPEIEPLVWAIDDWRQPMYWVPRDCPRVTFWPQATTAPEDFDRFFAYVPARMVIAIEAAWLPRLQATTLYRYLMPEETFTLLSDGFPVSREPVVPLGVERMDDLLGALTTADAELRICASLVPLGHAIIRSSLNFSLIRMRNAKGWIDSDAD